MTESRSVVQKDFLVRVDEDPDRDFASSDDGDLEDQYFWYGIDQSRVKSEVVLLDEERVEAEKVEMMEGQSVVQSYFWVEVEEEPDSDLETSEDVDLEDQCFWDVTDRSNMKHEVTGLDEERAEAEKGEQSKKKKKNRVKNSAGANLVRRRKRRGARVH